MSRFDISKNQLVVAMDHGRVHGVHDGLENPAPVIEAAIANGADAIMASYGMIKKFHSLMVGQVATILRIDGGASIYREEWMKYSTWRQLHTIEHAHKLGVDAVCNMTWLGGEAELDSLVITSRVAEEAREAGIVLMSEALPCPGEPIPDPSEPKAMADACRLSFEHGADVLKTYYTGTVDGFRQVTAGTPAPVLIAGGVRMDSDDAVLRVVDETMQAGGKGVVFGRNIWQSPNMPGMMRALRHIIHEGGSASTASPLVKAA